MQAVQFDSYIENGVIPVPLQYQNTIAQSVRVVVMPRGASQDNPQDIIGKKRLYSLELDMSGFTFDRDEINER